MIYSDWIPRNKLLSLEQISVICAEHRSQGRLVVQCHGVFDLLHPGHLRHFQAARRLGDVLVVSITADAFVNKGPGRPAFPEALRAEALSNIECIDHVVISNFPSGVQAINAICPNFYVKGNEYAEKSKDITGNISEEERAVKIHGGEMHYTDDITFSASNLINSFLGCFPPETEQWLRAFRKERTPDQILRHLDNLKPLRPLVIGEAIIDEYAFCDGLGKATKDPILVMQSRFTEAYAGGSLAVANHLAGFCNDVSIITCLGDRERQEEFIRKSLLPNVKAHFVTRHGSPTIHKRRIVDRHTQARVLELYQMDDTPLSLPDEAAFLDILEGLFKQHDLIIIADYGHGLVTPGIIRRLCGSKAFLAINTQANAGNRGFNTISKFARADYVCIAGHEIALETRMKHAPWKDLLTEVMKKVDCPCFAVTQGKDGIWFHSEESGFVQTPALATKVVDRVGAGDAVLAISSLLRYQRAPWDIIGFVSNLAGAEMVSDLGNRVSINKVALAKHATALMR